MDPSIREMWVFLHLLTVARVFVNLSLKDNGQNAKSLGGLYRVPYGLKWLKPKLGLGHLI